MFLSLLGRFHLKGTFRMWERFSSGVLGNVNTWLLSRLCSLAKNVRATKFNMVVSFDLNWVIGKSWFPTDLAWKTTLTVYYCLKLPLSLLRTAQNHPMVGTPFTMLWYYFARYTLFESFLFGRHLWIINSYYFRDIWEFKCSLQRNVVKSRVHSCSSL